jgi:hypothetical protein
VIVLIGWDSERQDGGCLLYSYDTPSRACFKPVSHWLARLHGCLAQAAAVVWAISTYVFDSLHIDFNCPGAHYSKLLFIRGHFVCDGFF